MIKNYFNKPISKRFIDAFPKFKADKGEEGTYFWESWLQSPFYTSDFTEEEMKEIYNHLLAEYYNSHFIYLDDLGIRLNIFHTIEEYYPNVKQRLLIVKNLRELTLDQFKESGVAIDSQGSNPKVYKQMDELIDQIDSQTASFQLKSEEQALKAKFFALYDGVMEEFIGRFKKCFVKLYSGLTDYLYFNPTIEEEK